MTPFERTFRSFVVAAGCFLAAVPAQTLGHSTDDAAIRSAYKALARAQVAESAVEVSALLTIDFYQRLMNGTVETREAYIRDETDVSGVTRSSIKYDLTRVRVQGDAADSDVTYTYVGTYSVDGVSKPLHGTAHLSDKWTLGQDRRWRLRLSSMHDSVAYVDGKMILSEREQLPPMAAAVADVQTRAVTIPTLALDSDPGDLAGIGIAIGDARIVGMGEGSHGTSEFFALKNRLFKYLVEKKGFTVLAMEAYWGAGLYVDRYIKTGQGTAQKAVASLAFWTWDTPEVVSLVQWMHDYNMKPGKHPILSFIGIDMQSPMGAIGYLAAYFSHHYSSAEAAVADEALQCAAAAASLYVAQPATGCRKKLEAVNNRLDTTTSDPDAGIAQRSLATVVQYLDWKEETEDAKLGTRDRDMAANLKWYAAVHPSARIAIWAHNYHIAADSSGLTARPMGAYLRSAFGSNYYAIAQTFGGGSLRAIVDSRGLVATTVPPSPGDTIRALFGWLKAAAAFIDFRGLREAGALKTFFSTERSIELIGATIDPLHPAYVVPMIVPKSYDGLVYVPVSTAATDGSNYRAMHREIESSDGNAWEISGVGFDTLTATAMADGAIIGNLDGLNASPYTLLRRINASNFAGTTVRVTGEVRSSDLLGFVYPTAAAVADGNSVTTSRQGDPMSGVWNGTWMPFAIELKVPQGSRFIDAGFWAEGVGTVAIQNVAVTATNRR